MHLISLRFTGPTSFGTLQHHHQALHISCCETKKTPLGLSLHYVYFNFTHFIYVCIVFAFSYTGIFFLVYSEFCGYKFCFLIAVFVAFCTYLCVCRGAVLCFISLNHIEGLFFIKLNLVFL